MKCIIFSLALCLITSIPAAVCSAQSISDPDPLKIPLSVRQGVYRKGNLIPNAGFEEASLAHWQVVGKHVLLTEGKDSADAAGSKHAIRITRTKKDVNEVDGGSEGVLSEYIEVIPGNYQFDLDIRLKNIFPSVERFDGRIGKGIDVHLEFFNADKKPISPGYYFEYLGREVDNGFKGFAFSNFFYIDEFGWKKVHGRSWNYPFSEGDLPAGCKYVKVFAGLNCSGTMWVDNLDLHMSRWSFTPIERVDSFFTRNYTLSEMLIPTPRQVMNAQPIGLKGLKASLVYDGPPSLELNAAFSLLRKAFFPVYRDSVRLYTSDKAKDGLQIVFGPGGETWKDARAVIAGKEQGYFIRRQGNTIYIGANKPQGLYYGAATLCQLVDVKKSTLDYADITDYPDFTGRSTVLVGYQNDWAMDQDKSLTDSMKRERVKERERNLDQQVKDIDFYARYKINLLYNNYFQYSKRWWEPGEFYTKTYFSKIGAGSAPYGEVMKTAVQVNPYFHINMEQRVDTLTDSLVRVFAHGTQDGFDKVLTNIKPALDAGAKTVMYCADDYIPHVGAPRGEYTLFNPLDKVQFTNLAHAQAFMLNKLKKWLDSAYKDIRLEFVPAQYNNFFSDYTRGSAETFFHDLMPHLDPSIVIVWTGNTIRSISYDPADIYRFSDMIKVKPMVWDNTPYARVAERLNGGYPINYPAKSVLCNIFEPFDIEYPSDFPSYVDGRYYSNLGGFGETAKIKYLTFSDFAWNTKDYNPDLSLYKALVRFTGKDNARLLLQFNAAYFEFVAIWGKLRMETFHDPKYQCTDEEKRIAGVGRERMSKAFAALKKMDNKDLVLQMEAVMKAKTDSWDAYVLGKYQTPIR